MKYRGDKISGLRLAFLVAVSILIPAAYAQKNRVVDDLYNKHDLQAIIEEEQQRAAEIAAIREQIALRDIENAGRDGFYYGDEIPVSTSYKESYYRRLRGFESLTYRKPRSYSTYFNRDLEWRIYQAANLDYNVVVLGDEIWMEPRYLTSFFGSWGSPVNVNISFGYGGLYTPYWNWAWSSHPIYFSWGYNWGWPYYGYLGINWGWGHYHPGYWGYHWWHHHPPVWGGGGGYLPGGTSRYNRTLVYDAGRRNSGNSAVIGGRNTVGTSGSGEYRRRGETVNGTALQPGSQQSSGATYQRRNTGTTGSGSSGTTTGGSTYDRGNSSGNTTSSGSSTPSSYQRRNTSTGASSVGSTPSSNSGTSSYQRRAAQTVPTREQSVNSGSSSSSSTNYNRGGSYSSGFYTAPASSGGSSSSRGSSSSSGSGGSSGYQRR